MCVCCHDLLVKAEISADISIGCVRGTVADERDVPVKGRGREKKDGRRLKQGKYLSGHVHITPRGTQISLWTDRDK